MGGTWGEPSGVYTGKLESVSAMSLWESFRDFQNTLSDGVPSVEQKRTEANVGGTWAARGRHVDGTWAARGVNRPRAYARSTCGARGQH